MDGCVTLSLEEDQVMNPAPRPVMEMGEWVAVSAGDSAMMVWFPVTDRG